MSTQLPPGPASPAATPQSIESLEHRIRLAERERDALRAPGNEELYLQAASMVSALELQLEERLRANR